MEPRQRQIDGWLASVHRVEDDVFKGASRAPGISCVGADPHLPLLSRVTV